MARALRRRAVISFSVLHPAIPLGGTEPVGLLRRTKPVGQEAVEPLATRRI